MTYFEREYFQPHPGKLAYLDYLVQLLRSNGLREGSSVLDAGSGAGLFLGALGRAGFHAVGIELDPSASAQARQSCGAEVHTQSVEVRFPFPDETFDAITLLDVIEHLHAPEFTLAEIRRCLRPGGLLICITLNAHSIARPILGKRWAWYQDSTHVAMYTPDMLRRQVTGSGFRIQRMTTILNFLTAGESAPVLRPLRKLARVIHLPWFGDSLLVIARRV